ncbi:group I truncated hemoglobin [Novosphingopyxis sp.]|uniref:group I truncated hemoglobin n=1 Tax=Novosphingopyxis sp. TaxID=2709690 RepID=UPI003B5CA0ED
MPIILPLLLLIQSAEAPVQPPAETSEQPVDWAEQFGFEEEKRDPVTGEFPVDPYEQSNANAGATPVRSDRLSEQFGGQEGIRRMTDRLIEINLADPRISAIFEGHDLVRLRRTLFEQFCYVLDAGCDYSGRDMRAAHQDMGLQIDDMNALVENLQKAMRERHIVFASQNRLLAKLAPMKHDVLQQ